MSRLVCSCLMLGALSTMVFACGGDDGGGGGTPDAKVFMDAPPVLVDAPPAGLSGLGQKCGQNMPACPTTAPQCLTFTGATVGICSLLCHMDAMIMTNAQSQISSQTDLTADNSKCTAIFSGTPGTAACQIPVNVMPTPTNPLQPNTTFTYQAFCGISCGAGNTCPGGLTCNTQVMWCLP